MPSNERVRLDDAEDSTPVNQPRQREECDTGRVIGPPRLDLALQVQRQLLAQKKFSATSWVCGRNMDAPNRRTSAATRAIIRTWSREQGSAMPWDITAADARPD
jgi:hypothetical protein